jgi:hypothetical protein
MKMTVRTNGERLGPLHEIDLLNGTKSDKYSTVLATDFEKLKLFAQSYQNDDSYYLNESSSRINANFEYCIFSSSSSLSPRLLHGTN